MSDKLRYIVNSLQGTSTLQCVIGVVITECVIEHLKKQLVSDRVNKLLDE